jgi:hypothetical protein
MRFKRRLKLGKISEGGEREYMRVVYKLWANLEG